MIGQSGLYHQQNMFAHVLRYNYQPIQRSVAFDFILVTAMLYYFRRTKLRGQGMDNTIGHCLSGGQKRMYTANYFQKNSLGTNVS